MEKTYIMTIRDLSNEAKELNVQAVKVKAFEEEVKKEIKIISESHITAIASYLNHQLDEVMKITDCFQAYFSNFEKNIRLEAKRGKDGNCRYYLHIKPYHYTTPTTFIVKRDNTIVKKNTANESLGEYEYELMVLLEYWREFKNEINESIAHKIKTIQVSNMEEQKRLKRKLSLYENFEL